LGPGGGRGGRTGRGGCCATPTAATGSEQKSDKNRKRWSKERLIRHFLYPHTFRRT
jgi:hypothetical protein